MTNLPNLARAVGSFALLTFALHGQATAPKAGLIFIQTISVPNWTATGTSQANFDLFAFNPQTRIMYVADRTNKSVTAIDTRTNSVVGVLPIPSKGSTNGVLVVPELQQLVVTDGNANVYVYDLRVPAVSPDAYVIPNITGGTDALDYDPFNRTVYVINGSAPYYMTGIDLINKTVAKQLLLPGSPELMRFNVNDGLMYQVITDGDNKNAGAGVAAYDPISNTIKPTVLTPNCVPHGIDIDPVTNVALVGCGTNQPQVMLDLRSGTIIKTFPDVTGADLLLFNPGNRRFYTGTSSNVSTTTGCPADTTTSVPVIGVFSSSGAGQGQLNGVQCAGRNSHGLGVDPIQNFIYVGARQYPADPNDANTGQTGVLIFADPAPAQPLTTQTSAVLKNAGTLTVRNQGRGLRGTLITSAIIGTTALVTITTTVGYEVIPCGIDPKTSVAFCDGPIIGDPLIGGVAVLAIDGKSYSSGMITGK